MSEFPVFLQHSEIYKPDDILNVLKLVRPNFNFSYSNKKEKYFNVPCSFDIETSSFFRLTGKDTQKVAIMYEWTFGIYGLVIIGRTWEEFIEMLDKLSKALDLNEEKRLIVYVHNLAYEFQFMRLWFKWNKIFSLKSRKPVYALTDNGIEFRCSYILSGYSLAKLGDMLIKYKVKKLVGELDYNKIRHSKTELKEGEISYCINDVKVVMAYIAEQIEKNNGIAHIPLTKTGYVRNYCRNSCFHEKGVSRKKSFKRLRYLDIMKGLRISPEEYKQLQRAFQGGFTHANVFSVNKVIKNVTSFDFTSSYPCVMIAEEFPMSSSEFVDIKSKEELEKNLKLYCCLFDIEITGIIQKLWQESYLSISRCRLVKNATINNGRVVSADKLTTTITEQDYMILNKFYDWDSIRIFNFRRYKKGYLPTDFVKSILKLYGDKTTLKGVEGKESEYLNSKEMLNSCYGMAVTNILRPKYEYVVDTWAEPVEPEIERALIDYNNSVSRFLFYPWGVWVTAYARRNLFTGILAFGNDYIYSDTDSIKVKNADKHMDYIKSYNDMIRNQLYSAMDYHKLDKEMIEPETIKHVKKCLGVWDFDGHYELFKTLGAKRYLVKYSNDVRNAESNRGKYNLTVSGLNKYVCVPYMLEKYGEKEIFDNFTNHLYIPPDYTGKNTHTYIDDLREGIVTDYLGVAAEYYEKSSVHLEKADYSLKLSREYSDYLMGLEEIEL